MSEKIPGFRKDTAPSSKQDEWDALAAAFAEEYPELEVAHETSEKVREAFKEFESLCDKFEHDHDMEALYAITELDPKTARLHPVREPARQDLIAIRNLENYLKSQEEVPKHMLAKVRERYLYIDRAIGNHRNGALDHGRPGSESR